MASFSNPIPVPGLDLITNLRLNTVGGGGGYYFTYDVFRPAAQPAAPSAPALPPAVSVPIPEPALPGHTWGWPIPITAGKRALPGRLIRRRLTRDDAGHNTFDGLLSFGWRAEVMGGFDPADFDATKLVANGVDIWLKDAFTFPGGTVTIHDGLQLTPIWADIDGSDSPAYIYHILADVRGLPLAQFNEQIPDQWSLHCVDVSGGPSFTGLRTKWDAASETSSMILSNVDATATCANGNTNDGNASFEHATTLDGVTSGLRIVAAIRIDAQPLLTGVSADATEQRLVAYVDGTSRTTGFLGGMLTAGSFLSVRAAGGFGVNASGFTASFATIGTVSTGDIIMVAIDTATVANTAHITWGRNGTWGSVAAVTVNPVTGFMDSLATGGADILIDSLDTADGAAVTLIDYPYPPPTGFTSYTPDPDGITLARWFQLAAGLAADMKGKVTVAANITDVLDSFFFVDADSTFARDATAMCRAANCDMRENNNGIEIVRGCDGTTFSVDLAVPRARLLRTAGETAIGFTRKAEQSLPSEIRLQMIASEDTTKFTERPARWERGPRPTSVSTKVDSIRVQAGVTLNQIQTYASLTLDRETEARDEIAYNLPWQDAISVQPGDVHTVPEDDVTHVVKVTQANRDANHIVAVQGVRMHTAQVYEGVADIGTGLAGPIALAPVTGTITGSITPTGAFGGLFIAVDSGVLIGSVTPTGSLSGTFTTPGTGSVLLEDGISHVLLEDGTSKLLLE